jgi:hypothetical protein
MSRPLRGVEAVKAALRAWQDYHMDGHGWSDIAYQEAYDQAGNTYILRGLTITPGANGDTAANATNGALLLILAPGEEPTDEMIAAVRDGVRRHRALFPRSTAAKGHSEVRPEPTACPGPIVMRLLGEGAFEPTPPRPAISPTLRKITDAIRQARKDGYTELADRLKRAREAARGRHGQ